MRNKNINHEMIRDFIEGKLSGNEADTVKKEIHESQDLFNIYMEIKESLFLLKTGKKASKRFEENILKMVDKQKAPHFKYILRLLKDEIIVISGDQTNLNFQGIKANFAYRSENKTDSVVINRQIDGHKLSIIITPVEATKEFTLSVLFEKNESFEVLLLKDSHEIEKIADTSVQKMFNSRLFGESEIDLVFKKDNETNFSVNLQFQSE
jgi:hypothetical protein